MNDIYFCHDHMVTFSVTYTDRTAAVPSHCHDNVNKYKWILNKNMQYNPHFLLTI